MRVTALCLAGLAAGLLWPVPEPVPCPAEDSVLSIPCVWDAEARGDGEGRSYVSWPDGTVTYLSEG